MNKLLQFTSLLLFTSLFFSCEKEAEPKYFPGPPAAASEKLFFSSNPLVFLKGESDQKKVVLTSSDLSLEYSILEAPDWVYLSNHRGTIQGLHDFIVGVDTFRSFPFGIIRDSIVFYSIYGESYLEVQFINGKGEQIVVEDTIEIGELTNSSSFMFFNRSTDSISYSLNGSQELSLSQHSGTIQSLKSTTIDVEVNRSTLTQDTSYFNIELSFNNDKKNIVVKVLSYFENKIPLKGNIADAAYDSKNKKLYYLNTKPYELVKFNPVTESSQTLSLSYEPFFISLSSSGDYAAIANDGSATLINLSTFSEIKNFNTGTNPSDIVLKDSAFAYVFPKVGTHVKVQCIDLQNNYLLTESTGWTISDDSKAALHPTLDAIYVADNGVSPSDIDKLDISNGTADLLYDSPYHGDYNMGGDLWIAKDGTRLITRGKTVLNTTSQKSTDLVYAGSLNLNIPSSITQNTNTTYFLIKSLDEDLVNDRLIIAAYDRSYNPIVVNQVYLHKASNLQHLQSFNLESFYVPSNNNTKYDKYKAEPFFTCFTGSGDEILVITKGTGSGLADPWAIELITP